MSVKSVNRSGLRSALPVPNMLEKLQILLGSERKSGTAVSEFHVRLAVCQPVTRKAVLLRSSRWFYAKLTCKSASTEGHSPSDMIQYNIGTFLPVAALPFVFLANRGIKKDEELVKSLDRLR